MTDVPDDERLKYRQFVELLNTIRSKDLVSAERRRELAKRWSAEPEKRDLILEEIERITEEHNRQLIKEY